jgi:exonuclease SbcC
MRILAIRFQNLNSLRGEHVVNLESGPLAEAGIFAITGPTGAGKSTILDAITLALYARAARYGKSGAEDMMSRGVGECSAEVTFACRSGRYTARWMRRRSRGKGDGNFQPPKHELSDTSGIIEEKTSSVIPRIEALTGLDYERFLRSVLLAQGQFAAFLKADTKERADLLQRITGSHIYAELGSLAYRIHSGHEEDISLRSARLSAREFLSEEARAALEAQGEALSATLQQRAVQEAALRARLALGQRAVKHAGQWAQLLADEARHAAEVADFAPQRASLERHAAAVPFLTTLEKAQSASNTAAEAAATLTRQQTATAEAERAAALAAGGVLLAFAEAEQAAAREQAALRQRLESQEAALAAAQSWLAAHAGDAALNDQLPALSALVERWEAAARRVQELQAALEQASQTVAEAESRHAERVEAVSLTAAAAAAAAETLAQADAGMEALFTGRWKTAEAVEAEGQRLERITETLRRLATGLTSLEARGQSLGALQTETARLVERAQASAAQEAAAREALAVARLRETDLLERVRLEELTRSLEQHRAHLTAGEPCPLCGAPEHPWSDPDNFQSSSSQSLLQEHGAHLRTVEQRLAEATSAAADRRQQLTAAEARAQSEAGSLQRDRMALEAEWTACGEPGSLAAAVLVEAAGTAAVDLAAATALRRQVRECVQQQQTASLQAALAKEKAQSARGQCEAADAARQAARAAQEKWRTECSAAGGALELITSEVHAAFPDPGASPAESLRQVQARAAQWREKQTEARALEQSLTDIRHEAGQHALQGRQRAERRRQVEAEIASAGITPASEAKPAAPEALQAALRERHAARQLLSAAETTAAAAAVRAHETATALTAALDGTGFAAAAALQAALLDTAAHERLSRIASALEKSAVQFAAVRRELEHQAAELAAAAGAEPLPDAAAVARIQQELDAFLAETQRLLTESGGLAQQLQADAAARAGHAAALEELDAFKLSVRPWARLSGLIGSADGARFSRFAQSMTMDGLVAVANRRLTQLCDRYRLLRAGAPEELQMQIADAWQADAVRPMESLSGGETFLVSLALALGLSELAGRHTKIGTLFIDEGFGTLDSAALDMALSALEGLRTAHSCIGVISHVEALKARLTTQVEVTRGPGGWSQLLIKS